MVLVGNEVGFENFVFNFFFFCLMFSFAYSLVFGNKNFKFKCRSVSLIDN